MPAVHDRGGWPTDEPIDRDEHEWADWERQTQSLRNVLEKHGIMNVDELRRGIEAIGAAEYEASTYFERWSASLETILVDKGVLTTVEISDRAQALRDLWGYPN